jgi:hypothetical protein
MEKKKITKEKKWYEIEEKTTTETIDIFCIENDTESLDADTSLSELLEIFKKESNETEKRKKMKSKKVCPPSTNNQSELLIFNTRMGIHNISLSLIKDVKLHYFKTYGKVADTIQVTPLILAYLQSLKEESLNAFSLQCSKKLNSIYDMEIVAIGEYKEEFIKIFKKREEPIGERIIRAKKGFIRKFKCEPNVVHLNSVAHEALNWYYNRELASMDVLCNVVSFANLDIVVDNSSNIEIDIRYESKGIKV